MGAPGTTPGPWRVMAWSNKECGIVATVNGKSSDVCGYTYPANACQIAASPDMYDAIERAKELIGARNDNLSEAVRQANIAEAWHTLDAASAKARGEGE